MIDKSFTVTEEYAGKRVDLFLAHMLKDVIGRSRVQASIKDGHVTINDETITTTHHKVVYDDVIAIAYEEPKAEYLEASDMPLDILFEDDDILIVNKAAGVVVHPGAGNKVNTLVHGLLFHIRKLSTVGEEMRPGIVHRIDKDTSGVLVIAKSNTAHLRLAKQFKEHTISRKYLALVKGVVDHDEGKCDAPLGPGRIFKKRMIVEPAQGKHALTYFKVLERLPQATLLELTLKTGRTHQIRVHMAHLGHPVIGDSLYGVRSPHIDRQALHAAHIGLTHPITNEYIECTSDMPHDMQRLLEELRT